MHNNKPLFSTATDIEVFALERLQSNDLKKPVLQVSPGFKGTVAAKKRYKIYVVLNADGVHYVGCTCVRMSERLNVGLIRIAEGKNGYHGYKWLSKEGKQLQGMQLLVFNLPGLAHPAANEADTLLNKQIAERIEAELVYAIRASTRKWPLSQHEIHFHNLLATPKLAKLTTKIAQQIFGEIKPYLLPPAIKHSLV